MNACVALALDLALPSEKPYIDDVQVLITAKYVIGITHAQIICGHAKKIPTASRFVKLLTSNILGRQSRPYIYKFVSNDFISRNFTNNLSV